MPALPPIGLADLHVHPSGNAVSAETARAVYGALRASGLQVAVLTDHDRVDIAQALVARSRDERIPIELVVGEEITTTEGHLLGVGLTARVAAGLSLADAVAAIHDQGGIAVVAHPLLPGSMAGRWRPSLPSRRPRGDASACRLGARVARTSRTAGAALRVRHRRRVRRPRGPLGRARPDRLPRGDRS